MESTFTERELRQMLEARSRARAKKEKAKVGMAHMPLPRVGLPPPPKPKRVRKRRGSAAEVIEIPPNPNFSEDIMVTPIGIASHAGKAKRGRKPKVVAPEIIIEESTHRVRGRKAKEERIAMKIDIAGNAYYPYNWKRYAFAGATKKLEGPKTRVEILADIVAKRLIPIPKLTPNRTMRLQRQNEKADRVKAKRVRKPKVVEVMSAGMPIPGLGGVANPFVIPATVKHTKPKKSKVAKGMKVSKGVKKYVPKLSTSGEYFYEFAGKRYVYAPFETGVLPPSFNIAEMKQMRASGVIAPVTGLRIKK